MIAQADILKLWHREDELAQHIAEAEQRISEAMGMRVKLKPVAFENHCAIAAICRLIADTLHVPYESLLSSTRRRNSAEARQLAVYMVRKHLPHIGPEDISAFFGTSNGMVYGSVNVIKKFIDINDQVIMSKVARCEQAFFMAINNKPHATDLH